MFGMGLPRVPDGVQSAWIQFPASLEIKAAGYEYLLRQGVAVNWAFRYSCAGSYGMSDAPNSERAARSVSGLPNYPGLAVGKACRVSALLRKFVCG